MVGAEAGAGSGSHWEVRQEGWVPESSYSQVALVVFSELPQAVWFFYPNGSLSANKELLPSDTPSRVLGKAQGRVW